MVNFSQHVCTSAPMTRLGLSVGWPAASRRLRQVRLWASSASMIASEEPMVAVPTGSQSCDAWNRRPSMLTTRSWRFSLWGYSSWSMRFLLRFSRARSLASGSIQVVTKLARFRTGLPSRFSSSLTSW